MSRSKDKHEGASGRTHHIMSEAERASGRRGGWATLEVTGGVRALAPQLFQLTHLTALYLNDNSLQRIPPEINQLVNLHTLDISNNKLRSLPAELGDIIQLRELHLHNNYLRVLPYELGKLFHLQMLGLQGNPLSKEMLSIYNENNGTSKLLTYMLDNLQVSATLPPQRPWIPLTRPNGTRPTCIFTVMCYNVLCDKYATRQMYGYCPSWALEWDYRKKGILDEIRHYSADIISLQEVETDQFYNFFLPELKQDGYDGIFSPKSRAKTMAESDRKYVDGCAIFFRSAKFSLVKEHLIEFNQLAMANSEGSDNMLNRVMPKDNIGLAALIKTKEAAWENGIPTDSSMVGQPILVCTAHIHWDPEFCDVKLIQTMMLSNELRNILDDSARTLRLAGQRDNVQLLLCGDLNSLPDSGVVEFLSSGRVPADHRDFKALGYAGSLRRMPGSDHEFTHNFKLASAYSEDIMPYTNYTYDFKGIIDYIFYSKQSMTPLGLLGPLSQEWFREHKVVGCPHPHIPSDHFPLLVELEMCPSTSGSSSGLIGRRWHAPRRGAHQPPPSPVQSPQCLPSPQPQYPQARQYSQSSPHHPLSPQQYQQYQETKQQHQPYQETQQQHQQYQETKQQHQQYQKTKQQHQPYQETQQQHQSPHRQPQQSYSQQPTQQVPLRGVAAVLYNYPPPPLSQYQQQQSPQQIRHQHRQQHHYQHTRQQRQKHRDTSHK